MNIGMKRPNQNQAINQAHGGFNAKQQRKDVSKIRLLVLGEYAGTLIGKGGENCKRIRNKYGVQIDGLAKQGKDVTILQITGTRGGTIEVLKELLPMCPESYFPSGKQQRYHEVNLLVDQKICGLLIGKGGSQYKEICQEFGIQLKVYPSPLPNSDERVVAIGDNNVPVIVNTVAKILHVLDQSVTSLATKFFDPPSQTLPERIKVQGGHNKPDGQNQQAPLQQFQKPGFQNPQFQNPEFQNHGNQQFPNKFPNPQQQNAGPKMGPGPNMGPGLNNGPGGPNMGPGGPNMGPGGPQKPLGNPALNQIAAVLVEERNRQTANGADATNDFGFVKTTTTLTMSHGLSGVVIGQGGQNILYMKNTSGAHIEFSKAVGNSKSQERTVTITGTQYQVQIAEQLMASCIRTRNAKMVSEGRGGPIM